MEGTEMKCANCGAPVENVMCPKCQGEMHMEGGEMKCAGCGNTMAMSEVKCANCK